VNWRRIMALMGLGINFIWVFFSIGLLYWGMQTINDMGESLNKN